MTFSEDRWTVKREGSWLSYDMFYDNVTGYFSVLASSESVYYVTTIYVEFKVKVSSDSSPIEIRGLNFSAQSSVVTGLDPPVTRTGTRRRQIRQRLCSRLVRQVRFSSIASQAK